MLSRKKQDMIRRTRVVVTGMGVVSSIGIGLDAFWKNLIAGKSGISQVSSFDSRNFRTHKAGEIKDFDPSRFMKNPEYKGRAAQFLLAAARMAIEDAGLSLSRIEPSARNAVIGTSTFEPNILEDIDYKLVRKGYASISSSLITRAAVNSPDVVLGRELGFAGVILTISTLCSAGNYAIGYGFDLIRQGKKRMVFCCATDVFSRSLFAGFNRLLIVAPDRCQPFDKNRKGIMLGEGAAVLILESLESALGRKAYIYAEVLGYGLSCDAYSLTISSKEGMKKVMERAIRNSCIKKEEVDYISAHGTGTINNDRNETQAIREIFGSLADNIPVSSIKSMLGHTISVASALEAISCCLSIRDNTIPATINFETPDPECDIDVVANKPRKKKVDIAMNNSFAFGGNNACVIFARIDRQKKKKARSHRISNFDRENKG